MRRDMDETIQGWPYEPEPGEVLAREVRARDGRTVIQIRVELGVLQLEVGGRPDGTRPARVRDLSSITSATAPRAEARSPGGKAPLVDDGAGALRRGRPRVRPVLSPPRRLAGAPAITTRRCSTPTTRSP